MMGQTTIKPIIDVKDLHKSYETNHVLAGFNLTLKEGDRILSENKVSTDEILKTINSTSENAKLITDNLVKITNQINSKKGTIGMLINDNEMSDNLKQTITNLKVTTENTSQSMTNLNKIITDLNNKNNVIGALKDTITGRKIN